MEHKIRIEYKVLLDLLSFRLPKQFSQTNVNLSGNFTPKTTKPFGTHPIGIYSVCSISELQCGVLSENTEMCTLQSL